MQERERVLELGLAVASVETVVNPSSPRPLLQAVASAEAPPKAPVTVRILAL